MKQFLMVCVLAAFFTSCNEPAKEISIIPLPQTMLVNAGEFELKNNQTIGVSEKSLMGAAEYLSKILSSTGYNFKIQEGQGDINLVISTPEPSAVIGAYSLSVDKSGVNLKASDYKGIIGGISSLRQLLPAEIESDKVINDVEWTIPSVEITDAPAYEWRGLMLDVSRHFYSKDEIKEFLDLMALYKLNIFHWHLTDDQGWRIEIKKYPLLTEKGSWREFNSQDKTCIGLAKSTNNSDYELPKDKLKLVDGKTLYGGFYTQEDIKEIVKYATSLGIDIIPEVDMPGHCLVAVENYDGIACTKKTGWKYFSSPVCPGKESAMSFCKDVYAEIFELFPFEYVHLGADEVEKAYWEECPDCQKRMKKNGLKTENELQAWFVKDMEKFFNENGKKLVGWDEILEGGLSPTATITWWRSWHDAAKNATAQGNGVILSPNSFFYFDYAQDNSTIKRLYESNVIANLSVEEKKLVKGMQANIWCEWIPSREQMQYMVFPRALAVAEKAWSGDSQHNWECFDTRMKSHLKRLNVLNVNYRIPDLVGVIDNTVFVEDADVKFECPDENVSIRYTEDGSLPTMESKLYTKPFKVSENCEFKVATFRPSGKRGDIRNLKFTKSNYQAAVVVDGAKPGLKAVWHDFTGNKCAAISDAPIKETYDVEEVIIPKGVKGNIGLIFTGYFNAPADDIYTFIVRSDDGSVLKISDQMIVDNDGMHSPKEKRGQAVLKKGFHPFEVRYFDPNGGLLSLKILDKSGKELIVKEHLFK